MSITIETTATILEKGDLSISSEDVRRYDSDCNSLMKEIGEVITRDITIPTKGRYYLVFFHFELEDTLNLMNIQGLVGAFFTIVYDRDLDFEYYKKGESQITKDMRYMILAD